MYTVENLLDNIQKNLSRFYIHANFGSQKTNNSLEWSSTRESKLCISLRTSTQVLFCYNTVNNKLMLKLLFK